MTPFSAQRAHVDDERLAAYLDDRLTPDERSWTIAHVAECNDCRQAMVAARRLLDSTAAAPTWRRFAPVLVAAAIAVVVLPGVFQSRLSDRRLPAATDVPKQRAAQPDAGPIVDVTSPVDGATIDGSPIVLRWRPAGTDATYRIVVQDSAGALVWETTVAETTVVVPRTNPLTRGQEYFWSVDAQLADGRPARGTVRRFTIR